MEQWVEAIAQNLVADVIFTFVLALLGLVLVCHSLVPAKRFFGANASGAVRLYVSAHEDSQTATRTVVTGAELEAAIDLSTALDRQFHQALAVRVAKWLSADPEPPAIDVQISPLELPEAWPDRNSLVLIGGPVRNRLTQYYLQHGEPWLTFNSQSGRFEVARGNRVGRKLDNSGRLAIVNRMTLNGRVIVMTFGYGERQTRSAVRYLVSNWRALEARFRKVKDFSVCLSIADDGGAVEVEALPGPLDAR